MTTAAQIAANRANARKSTGPRTQEGKARSRLNALKHGLTARHVLLTEENREAYERLRADLHLRFAPVGPAECLLVDRLALSFWRQYRAGLAEAGMVYLASRRTVDSEEDARMPHISLAVAFSGEGIDTGGLDRLARYERQIDLAIERTTKQLAALQAGRPAELAELEREFDDAAEAETAAETAAVAATDEAPPAAAGDDNSAAAADRDADDSAGAEHGADSGADDADDAALRGHDGAGGGAVLPLAAAGDTGVSAAGAGKLASFRQAPAAASPAR